MVFEDEKVLYGIYFLSGYPIRLKILLENTMITLFPTSIYFFNDTRT